MGIFDDVLEMKKTAAPDLAGPAMSFGKNLGKALATGAGAGIAGAALTGAGIAATKLYDAATKARDFRAMLGSSFNSDLDEMRQQRPREFNEAFSSLRAMNPSFTKDPMVAGTYLRRIMSFGPESAGGVLLEAAHVRKDFPDAQGPMMDAFQRSGTSAAGSAMADYMKPPKRLSQEEMSQQVELERAKAQARSEFGGGKGGHGPESSGPKRSQRSFPTRPETFGGTPDPTGR